MQWNDSILTLIIFLPLVGALIVACLPRSGRTIQYFALLVTLATFLLTLHLPIHFIYGQPGFQYEVNHAWITNPGILYHLGVDGLSMWLVVLTGFLAPLGVLISWNAVVERTKEFYLLFLLQQVAMLGIFVSLDLFLYYGFWELSLVPMALLIGMFGRKNGRGAAIKFFLYTFLPSALLLVAIVWLYAKTGTFDFVLLQQRIPEIPASSGAIGLVALAFLVAFAVKVPVFPLHAWLSDGISEAPTAAAMVLAGKLGLYSLLRFHLGLFPVQSRAVAPVMAVLGVIGILYGALVALVQTDLKRLAAYATLSGISFSVLGIYSFSTAGLDGAVYQTLNEGISAGALFMLLGILYERYGSYEISHYGGLAAKLPHLATLFVITGLSLIGLPILNGFVAEFLILSGTFTGHARLASVATAGVILSAAYMLWMLQRVFYGPSSIAVHSSSPADVQPREALAVWPMILLMLVMGVASAIWMRAIDGTMTGPAYTAPPAPSYVLVHPGGAR